MKEWLYNNFTAGIFHTKNFVAHFIRLKLNFIKKTKNRFFDPAFKGLRGNVHTPSMARWKSVVDFLFIIIELFALSPTVETLQVKIC